FLSGMDFQSVLLLWGGIQPRWHGRIRNIRNPFYPYPADSGWIGFISYVVLATHSPKICTRPYSYRQYKEGSNFLPENLLNVSWTLTRCPPPYSQDRSPCSSRRPGRWPAFRALHRPSRSR